MKLSQRFQIWLSRRGALALFITMVVLILGFQIWLKRPQPRISHVLGSSTQHVDMLWIKQGDTSNNVAANADGVIFMMPITEDSITAIDAKSANTIWKVELPFERSGPRGMLADKNTIFTVDSTRADAYETTTGELKWSTELGDGHVSVIPQLDSNILRIYYGDKLIEIDPKTGKILGTASKGITAWISGNIAFQISEIKAIALDRQSGKKLWTSNHGFYIDEVQEPINIGDDSLLVGLNNGICALNLQTGKHKWCRPEVDVSKIAIDYQTGLGYGMREDLVLLTIDLQTGDILGETSFLSSQPINKQIGFMSFITFSNGVVIVSFSDSGQTFGLSISQSSRIPTPGSTP